MTCSGTCGYAQEYADLFIGVGKCEVNLHASHWLTGFMMEKPLADLRTVLASLGLGLFISTLVTRQAQAIQSSFFFLLPNVLLSGFMFPREAMPPLAAWIGLLLPLTHFLQIMRGIVLKGVGLEALWPQALALVGFSTLFITFSTLRFHKQLE